MADGSNAAILSPLQRADGSASYSANGFSVICAINGPMEVQRRDELPEEAAIDVVVRPLSGVGDIRERHLESIIQSTLRHVILVGAHPRTLVQVTIQVTGTPGNDNLQEKLPQADSNLALLPALLQATSLALMTTSISLSMTFTNILLATSDDAEVLLDPSAAALADASSIHVLAFSSLGDLLVVESEGEFSIDDFEKIVTLAKQRCCSQNNNLFEEDDEDLDMESSEPSSKDAVLRATLGSKIAREQRWKQEVVK